MWKKINKLKIFTLIMLSLFVLGIIAQKKYFSLLKDNTKFQSNVLDGEKLASTISVQDTYDDIMNYLNRRINKNAQQREKYWSDLDTSSLSNYQDSIKPYRKKLSELISVPQECQTGKTPNIVKNILIQSDSELDIYFWRLQVCDDNFLFDTLVAIPKKTSKSHPLILAFHGQCGNPERVMGFQGDDYHHSFGLRLAKEGYIVIAPLLVTKPTTRGEECISPANTERNELDSRGLSMGERIVGIEVGKIISALDYLMYSDLVDSDQVASYGISMGGETAFFLGALDERIKVNIISQHIEDREEKLVGFDYQSALWKLKEVDYNLFKDFLGFFTDVEVAYLIIPRKLFIEVGKEDVRYNGALKVYSQIQKQYENLGLSHEYIEQGADEGGHEIFLTDSLRFLNRWMKNKN